MHKKHLQEYLAKEDTGPKARDTSTFLALSENRTARLTWRK